MDGLTAFPSGVNARVPCYGFNEGDWFIWNGLATSGYNNPPSTRGVFGPNLSRRIATFTDGTSQTLLVTDVKALNPFCQVGGQFSEPNLSSPTAPLPSPYAGPLSVASEYTTVAACNDEPARPGAHRLGRRQPAGDGNDHRLPAQQRWPATRTTAPTSTS